MKIDGKEVRVIEKTNSVYGVSKDGSVYNVNTDTLLKTHMRGKYPGVQFGKGDTRCSYLVHRLVALSWVPNPDKKPEVHHKDRNKLNYHYSNLQWVTREEHTEHTERLVGEANQQTTLTEAQVIEICNLLIDGLRNIDLARKYNVSKGVIARIKTKRSWNYITDTYNFDVKPVSKRLSEDTIQWICSELQRGVTMKQVVSISRNKSVIYDTVRKIYHRKTYLSISKNYTW